MSLLRVFGILECWLATGHIMGKKFRKARQWYQVCQRCGKVENLTEKRRAGK